MDKEDVLHTSGTYNGILVSYKKKTDPTICNNMEGARGYYLSEISQAEKDKYQMISLICGV